MGSKNKVKYNVGGVIVETDGSYENKFRVLRMAMDNWAKKNRNLPIDSSEGRRYGEDCEKFNEMKTLLQISTDNFDNGTRGKKHKKLMNEMFKRYST